MGYSLSWEESKKREKYVNKVRELDKRFKKFGVDYMTGDRSEVYKPMIVFPEYIDKRYSIHLYLHMGIMKAGKVIKQMEDNIISRDKLKKYTMVHGFNTISKMV